jgi:tetratricopeptide (TPR) repeat protein
VNPTDSLSYLGKGEVLIKGERKEEALEMFNQAISINPNSLMALCFKGRVLIDLN